MANLQLAENLRSYRAAHELTQEYVSMKLNISRQAYSNYERGLRTPDIDILINLSQLYNISLDQLVLVPFCNTKANPKSFNILCKDDESGNTTYVTAKELDYIIQFRHANESIHTTISSLLNAK